MEGLPARRRSGIKRSHLHNPPGVTPLEEEEEVAREEKEVMEEAEDIVEVEEEMEEEEVMKR